MKNEKENSTLSLIFQTIPKVAESLYSYEVVDKAN